MHKDVRKDQSSQQAEARRYFEIWDKHSELKSGCVHAEGEPKLDGLDGYRGLRCWP